MRSIFIQIAFLLPLGPLFPCRKKNKVNVLIFMPSSQTLFDRVLASSCFLSRQLAAAIARDTGSHIRSHSARHAHLNGSLIYWVFGDACA